MTVSRDVVESAAMTYEEIEITRDGAIATVTMSRADALNAITPTMLGELNDAFEALAADPTCSVAVLTGAGRAFSAGVDLKALGEWVARPVHSWPPAPDQKARPLAR